MFDPRRQMTQRPAWAQQLGQGLAAQPMMPPPRPMGGPQGQGQLPQGMPPQGPQGPMGPPGAGFLRDQDAIIRAALARRGQPIPVAPQGVAGPTEAPPPASNAEGGDLREDDPRMRGGYPR